MSTLEHQVGPLADKFCDLVIKEYEQNPYLFEILPYLPGLSEQLIDKILIKKVEDLTFFEMFVIAELCGFDLIELLESFI